MTQKHDTKATNGAAVTAEQILHVPLTDIFVDYDWNIRSKAEVMSDTSDAVQDTTAKGPHHGEGTGFKGLVKGIFQDGQKTQVVLRKVEEGKSLAGKKTDKPLELVCGFRRFTAVEALNADKEALETAKKEKRYVVPNTPDGTIRAEIKKLTAEEAELENGIENLQRQNISTPDQVRYIQRELAKGKVTQQKLADSLGIDQGYVSKLKTISTLPKEIIAHWRGDSVKIPGLPDTVTARLTVGQMKDLADSQKDSTPGDTIKRYVDMLNPPAPAEGAGGDSDPIAKRINDLGMLLGSLVRAGVIESGSLHWSRVIGPKKEGYIIDTGKADAPKRGEYWDLMEAAYERGLTPPKAEAAPKTEKAKDAAAAS